MFDHRAKVDDNVEQDPTIDHAIQSAARAIEMGADQDDIYQTMIKRGMRSGAAFNVTMAAFILAGVKLG